MWTFDIDHDQAYRHIRGETLWRVVHDQRRHDSPMDSIGRPRSGSGHDAGAIQAATPVPTKRDADKAIIETWLGASAELAAVRLLEEIRAAGDEAVTRS